MDQVQIPDLDLKFLDKINLSRSLILDYFIFPWMTYAGSSGRGLEPCCSRSGPQTSIDITWEQDKNTDFRPYPRPTESESAF